mgnify:CR=1 FL=1
MITKKELIIDIIFVIALALCLAIVLVCYNTAEASHEVSTVPTKEVTVEPKQEPIEEELPTIEETTTLYTEQDLEYLALAIYQEAGSDYCSDETRLAVGTVVMNRVDDSRFPNTIAEVLTQEGQYGRLHWTGLVWQERATTPQEQHAVQRAYRCAEEVLSGYRSFSSDVIWQAEFKQGIEIVSFQDGLYFCR